MKYVIDPIKKEPAYLQLYKLIREDITAGLYPYNKKLPSKRTVAEEAGISTVTVEHAYALLCDEGYIEAVERSGYFVIFRKSDGFFAPAPQNIPLISVYPQNESTVEFPFSVLARTMRNVLSLYGEAILTRSPNAGCYIFRSAISRYLARSRGIIVTPEQIVIGSGSEYLYGLIVQLLGRRIQYAIESPSYKKIEEIYKACGAAYQKLPLGNDGIESGALWNSNADVLHISPYRSFPSGVTASASKRHEYLQWASKGNRYIIEDDFESEFSISKKPKETLFSHSTDGNVIYMNTFSKTISASLRAGYMLLPKTLIQPFKSGLGFYSCTVPTYIQLTLAELIESGDFERHINRIRRQKRKESKECKHTI